MPTTSTLEILQILDDQSNKASAVNYAITSLESALADSLSINCSSASGSLSMPFVDTNDLSSREALRAIHIEAIGSPAAAFELVHPDNAHLFFFTNSTGVVCTVNTSGGTGADTLPGEACVLHCDGTDVTKLVAGTQTKDFPIHYSGTPSADEVLAKFYLTKEVVFSADFAGSVGVCGVPPATAWDILVQDDATTIGTLTVETDGSVSFVTDSSEAQTVAAGSLLELTADATVYSSSGLLLTLLSVSLN